MPLGSAENLRLHSLTAGIKTKAQSDLGLPQHSLVTDCVTRWGLQLHMIGRILEQETCIKQLLATDRKHSHLIPT